MVKLTRHDNSEDSTITIYPGGVTATFGGTMKIGESVPSEAARFHITPEVNFDSGYHFHISKTECFIVERGSLRLTMNGARSIVTPSDGEIVIPQWTAHRLQNVPGEEAVAWERTTPSDGGKEAFFRNFFSLLNDYKGLVPFLQAVKVLGDWDTYLIGDVWGMSHMKVPIVGLTKLICWVAGLAGYAKMYREYTPKELYDRFR